MYLLVLLSWKRADGYIGVRTTDKNSTSSSAGNHTETYAFNICFNHLFKLKSQSDLIGFANDTAILYKSNTWERIKEIVRVQKIDTMV